MKVKSFVLQIGPRGAGPSRGLLSEPGCRRRQKGLYPGSSCVNHTTLKSHCLPGTCCLVYQAEMTVPPPLKAVEVNALCEMCKSVIKKLVATADR